MQTVLIVIHLMIVLALVGIVLIQRSEGGGLGIGGGSGFMSARGTANALTRTTAILATLFFITSLGLGILARYQAKPTDILDRIPITQQGQQNGILDQLGGTSRLRRSLPFRTMAFRLPAHRLRMRLLLRLLPRRRRPLRQRARLPPRRLRQPPRRQPLRRTRTRFRPPSEADRLKSSPAASQLAAGFLLAGIDSSSTEFSGAPEFCG